MADTITPNLGLTLPAVGETGTWAGEITTDLTLIDSAVGANTAAIAALASSGSLTLTTTGTSGAATLSGATLNIPQYAGGGGGLSTIVVDHQGALAQQTANGTDQVVWTTTITGGIPAGAGVRVTATWSQDTAPGGSIYPVLHLGSSAQTYMATRNETGTKTSTALVMNNPGVQNAQMLIPVSVMSSATLGGDVLSASTGSENTSVSIVLKFTFSAPTGALYTPKQWLVEWVK
jgi:hypothetical protein